MHKDPKPTCMHSYKSCIGTKAFNFSPHIIDANVKF